MNTFVLPKHPFRFFLLCALLLALLAVVALSQLPLALRVTTYIVVVFGFNGWLTAALLYRKKSLWLQITFGLAFGLAEWIGWSRVWLLVDLPVTTLLIPVLVTGVLKALWLGREAFGADVRTPIAGEDWLLALPSLAVLGLMALAVLIVHAQIPFFPMNSDVADKAFYNMAIERFATLSGDLNWMFDRLVFGSNIRVTWNPWLFGLANMSVTTGIHTVQLTFAQLRPVLWIIPLVGYAALMAHLFKRPWMVMLAMTLQISLVVNADFDFFMFRLEEDKVLVLFGLMPYAWMFLIRSLRWHQIADVVAFFAITTTMALIHPMGVPALVLTGAPFVALHLWTSPNKRIELRWCVAILGIIGIGGLYTLWERQQVLANAFTQLYIAENGSLPQLAWFGTPVMLSDIERLILLVWVGLFLTATKKYSGRFVLTLTVLMTLYLAVPPFQGLASRALTTIGLTRFHWLLPLGLGIAYVVVELLRTVEGWRTSWQVTAKFSVVTLTLVILFGFTSYGATVNGGRWTPPYQASLPKFPALQDTYFEDMLAVKSVIGAGRVVTNLDIATMIPTLFPQAEVLVFNALVNSPTTYHSVGWLYRSDDAASVKHVLDQLQPDFVLTIADVPLKAQLLQNGNRWGYSVLSTSEDNALTWFQHSDNHPVPYLMPITLVADKVLLKRGACTQLNWFTSVDVTAFKGGTTEQQGSQRVCPDTTTTYQLETLAGKRQVTVFVEESPAYDFEVRADKLAVTNGECSTLRWQTNHVTDVRLYLPTALDEASVVVKRIGELHVCPTQSGAYVWTATSQEGKTVLRALTIYVLP